MVTVGISDRLQRPAWVAARRPLTTWIPLQLTNVPSLITSRTTSFVSIFNLLSHLPCEHLILFSTPCGECRRVNNNNDNSEKKPER